MAWIQLPQVLATGELAERWWNGETILEIERGLLGAMILGGHPEEAEGTVSHADFFDRRHGLIFRTILKVRSNDAIPDLRLVTHELERQGNLEVAGGAGYVSAMLDRMPDIENVRAYARYVKEAAIRRKLERKP